MSEEDLIKKEHLKKSISLISELKLDENDYEQIFNRFAPFLENTNVIEVLSEIQKIKDLEKEEDIIVIMRKITKTIEPKILIEILKLIIKDEKLIDFIQDLFLEKLI